MKKLLEYQATLIYYDGVQLFTGKDQLGTQYICLLVEQGDQGDRFLCAPISQGKLSAFYHSGVDLRDIFIFPESDELFLIETEDILQKNLELQAVVEPVPEGWLPDTGFIYEKPVEGADTIVSQSKEKNRAIISLSVNPPEALEETKITTNHLIDVLAIYQTLVKHAYNKVSKGVKGIVKEVLSVDNQSDLSVIGFSPGSFTIHFESETRADLVGYVDIAKGLQCIDEMTQSLEDTKQALEVIKKYKGHLAKAYLRLLEIISQRNIPVKYIWTIPEYQQPIAYSINQQRAKEVYKELIKIEKLGVENIEFVGKFTKADVIHKKWAAETLDQKVYSGRLGKSKNISLSGVVMDQQFYRFVCEETSEEVTGTGQERTNLYLVDFEPV
ncbi:MAG: DUF6575 domain-containing protein [Anaerolineales bacterium]